MESHWSLRSELSTGYSGMILNSTSRARPIPASPLNTGFPTGVDSLADSARRVERLPQTVYETPCCFRMVIRHIRVNVRKGPLPTLLHEQCMYDSE